MKYEVTAELNLDKFISELCDVAEALYECADNLKRIKVKYEGKEESEGVAKSDI